jgi:L-lactate dehydrogenase
MVSMNKPRVFIIGGGGMVGATTAHALASTETVKDIVLIDVAAELVRGQAADLNHATAYSQGVRVRVGSYEDIGPDDIIVITSGRPRQPGQTRLELQEANEAIIRDVTQRVMASGGPAFIVVVANPVDVMTHVAWETSGLPREWVFGTGTMLDTARLRVTLANALDVAQSDVSAYILGEHGDSSFAALSSATVGGLPLAALPRYRPELVETIEDDIRRTAADIIAAKKSTYFGIANVVVKVVQALGQSDASVLPVSTVLQGEYGLRDVAVSVPSLVSSAGAHPVDGYPLSKLELGQLQHSADVVAAAIRHEG